MVETLIYCHTCEAVLTTVDPVSDSKDHALDQHPETFASCAFTSLGPVPCGYDCQERGGDCDHV